MKIPPEIWDVLKLLVIPLSIWFFEWKFEKRDEKREREHIDRKREQDRKDEMIIRGLKTLSDCQYEVIYDMKNGEHNGGLDRCMEEVSRYRADVNEWITKRASWNR